MKGDEMDKCEHEIDRIESSDLNNGYQVTTAHCKKCGRYHNQYRRAVVCNGSIRWELDRAQWDDEPNPSVAAFRATPNER